MLEGVVSTLINTFLSKYVDGLDSEQLGLHLLGGELRLENVRIKGSALSDLHLPVEVDFGFIGLLHVQWDWTQLLSKPLLVEVRDVMLVVREKTREEAQHELEQTGSKSPVDADKKHKQLQKQKEAKLLSAEEFRLQAAAQKETAPGFMARIINAVIDNIQLNVRNIHIRYEHRPAAAAAAGAAGSPSLYGPCSIGLVLSELTLSSTDEHWETKFVEGAAATHKLVDLSSLFIYCNTRESPLAQRATPDSLRNIFQHLVPPPQSAEPSASGSGSGSGSSPALPPDPLCEYLLHPVNANVRAVVHYKEGQNRAPSQPLVALQVLIPLVELSVSQRQLHALVRVVNNLAGVQKRLAVFTGAFHESLDRPGTVDEREAYIALYKRTLSFSWEPTLSTSEGAEMAELERVVDFSDIDDWRVCAMAELVAEQPDRGTEVDDDGNAVQLTKRQKRTTGLLAGVNNAVTSVKNAVTDGAAKAKSGAKAAGSMLATTILPGVLTDKLGLTTAEQREEEAQRGEELRRDDAETKEDAGEEEQLEAEIDAQSAREPTIRLTDEQRQSVRAEALSSSQILFLPTGGKSRDCINATVDLTLTTLLVRLLNDGDSGSDSSGIGSGSGVEQPSPSIAAPSDLFRVSLHRLGVKLIQRIDSMRAQVELADLVVEDAVTPGTVYPQIVAVNRNPRSSAAAIVQRSATSDGLGAPAPSSSAASSSSSASFLSLVFEQNPLDESADARLQLHMRSLDLVVHPRWLERLLLFVSLPKDMDTSALGSRAALMQQMARVTRSETEHTLSEHKSMLMEVTIEGPSVAVVSDHTDRDRTPVLVLELASIGVHSRVQDKKAIQLLQDLLNQYTAKVAAAASSSSSSSSSSTSSSSPSQGSVGCPSLEELIGQEKEDLDHFYDTLLVSVTGVTAAVWPCFSAHKAVWSAASQQSTPILLPLDIADLVVDQCVAPHLTFLPAQRISGALPAIRLEVSVSLVQQLLSPAFIGPWKQLGKNMAAHDREATAVALRRGTVTERQLEFEAADKDGGAKPNKSASLSKAPSNPADAANKRRMELQVELHDAVAAADANPPAGPALSMQNAQEAAGFDFGVADSLHPWEMAWGSDDREITLKDLIIGLQSEKLARRVLAESGAYGKNPSEGPNQGQQAEQASSSECITLRQFQDWYEHRKKLLQHNINSQINVSVEGVHVAIVDDGALAPQQQQQPGNGALAAPYASSSSSSSVAAAPAISGRRHSTVLELSVLGLSLFMQQRAFDKVVGLEIGGIALRECGLEGVPLAMQPCAPMLRTSPLKRAVEAVTRGRRLSASANGSGSSSAGALPFLFLTMTAVSPESPGFAARPVATQVDLHLGEVELNLDPESLDRVACFVLQQLAPLPLRQRLARESKADAAEKAAIEAADPSAHKSDEHVPPVSERKFVEVRRNIDTLPEGQESLVSMQLSLSLGGVGLNLNSRSRSFAALSVVAVSARVLQRINSVTVDASVQELWLLDATDNVADRERAIIWVAQSLASSSYSAKLREQGPPPLLGLHFEQHDVANKVATGFQMSLDAQLLGLRARVAPVFALHMLDLATTAKSMRVLQLLEDEKRLQADSEEKEAEEKEAKEEAAKKAEESADAPKPPLTGVHKLRRRRPAKLKQQQVNWFWSADTPAPIKLNVLIDDIEIDVPLQSIEKALAMRQSAAATVGVAPSAALAPQASDATVEEARATKAAAAETKQSAVGQDAAEKRASMGHSLLLRLEGLRVQNRLKDADKNSRPAPGDTVRYEQWEVSLAALRLLTTHAPLVGSAFYPLMSLRKVSLLANRFSHGKLLEARADLGCLDVSLPHNQYVFLMRLVDTASDLGASFATASSAADGDGDAKAHVAAAAAAKRQPRQMLVRGEGGEIESKEEHDALRHVDEQRRERMEQQQEEEYASDSENDAEDGPEQLDPLRALPSIQAHLVLQRLSIELLRDDGLEPSRDSLLRVLLKQLSAQAALDQSTGEITAGVDLAVFRINDTSCDNLLPNQRPLVPAYRNILGFGTATADDEWLRERQEASASGTAGGGGGADRMEDRSRDHVEAIRAIQLPSAHADAEASPESAGGPSRPASSSALPAPLLIRAHRLGFGTSHAFEVDVEINHLQLLVAPALLALPQFFELPSDMVEKQKKQKVAQAKRAVEEKERTAKRVAAVEARMQSRAGASSVEPTLPIGVLASDEEKAAMAPSSDPLLMADALLMGTAAVKDKKVAGGASKTPPIFARFRMNQPVVLLVADPHSADTRGLVLSWSVDASASIGATPGGLQAQAALNGFSIVESAFVVADARGRELVFSQTAEPGQRPILPPFHLQVHAQSHLSTLFVDGVSTCLSIDAHLSRLDLNVGFRLYQLLTTAMENLQPPLERARKLQQEAEEKRAEEHKSAAEVRADIVTRIDDERNKVSDGAVPQDPLGPVVAGLGVGGLSFNEVNASLRAVGVYVNVINDAWETNLAYVRLQVDGLTVKAHRFGDSGGLWGHLDLRAEAFNHRILAWEPIIEPWSADFALHQCQLSHTPAASLLMASTQQLLRNEQKVGSAAPPAPPATSMASPLAPITSVSFTSHAPLNLNVSAALLEDMADALSDLQRSLRSHVQAWKRTTTAAPYRVVNHTDLPIDVYRADLNQITLMRGKEDAKMDQTEEGLSEVMRVPPFSSAHLDFADTVAIPVRGVRIQLQSSVGPLPCLIIPVARETSSKHSLQAGSGAMVVVVDVEWSAGVRVISVHSSMAVANQTNVPLIVSADRFQEKQLAPGERMWLPLIVAPQMHSVRVRPCSLEARRQFQRRTMREEDADAKETQELVSSVMGEFGWSGEIVLAAPQKNTKQKSTLVDHFSCPPDLAASAASAHSSRSELLVPGTVSVAAGASVDRHSSSLPAQGRAFHFTVFAAGCDVKSESETESAGSSSNIKRSSKHLSHEYHATTFYIRNPVTLENVLACDCQFRLLNGDTLSKDGKDGAAEAARVVEELTLARGKSCPLYGASTAKDTYLSLLVPSLAAGWSKPLKLRLSDPESSVLLAHLVGDNGGTLHVCVELKQVQGCLRVVAYTQMWMWDLSSANLQVSADKKSLLPQRARRADSAAADEASGGGGAIKNTAAHLESVSLPDKHAAVMFGYDNVKSSKGRLWVRAGRHPRSIGFDLAGPCSDNASDAAITWSEWSSKLSLDAPGNQSAISMRMGPGHSAGSYEVVADVQAGEGVFRRTKMVKFLPRYVLVNMLHVPLEVRQFGTDESSRLVLAPSQQILWHWPQALTKDRTWLSVRRQLDGELAAAAGGPTADWHWSGYFSVDSSGDSNVMVRHRSNPARLWHLRVEVRTRDGVSFVLVDQRPDDDATKLKAVLPYCISNRSQKHVLRVRQAVDAEKHWEDSSHLAKPAAHNHAHDDEQQGFQWHVLPPNSELPFCYEEPLLDSPRVEVQVARVSGRGADGSFSTGEWLSDRDLAQIELGEFDDEHAYVDLDPSSNSSGGGGSGSGATKMLSSAASSLAATIRGDTASTEHRLYYFSQQDGPTNFVVFSDQPSDAWKRRQLRQRLQEEAKAETHERNQTASRGDGSAAQAAPSRRTLTHVDDDHGAQLSAAEDDKQRMQARDEKRADRAGSRAAEHEATTTAQSLVERDVLAAGSGHLEDPSHLQTVGEGGHRGVGVVGSGVGMSGAQSLSRFPATPQGLLEHVSHLRVRILSLKSLRPKDKDLFIKAVLGNQTRQSDVRKRAGDDEVVFEQEMVFRAEDLANDMRQQPQSPGACSCFSTAGSRADKHHLYVDVYQRHTLLSDSRVGSVALSLSNIGEEPTAHWFQLRKNKAGENEARGMIQMAVWYQLKTNAHAPSVGAAAQVALPHQQQQSQAQAQIVQPLGTGAKALQPEMLATEPRAAAPLTAQQAQPPAVSGAKIAAGAGAGAGALHAPLESPRFESLDPSAGAASSTDPSSSVPRVSVSMMGEDCVSECSWSEFSVRMVDTLNLERVASALMVDTTAGRIVCYITAPLFRRGFSVLVTDRAHNDLLHSWTNQTVTFALPDQLLAAARPQDAVLRFSFYFYASVVSGAAVQTSASWRESHRLTGGAQMAGIADPSVQPILIGSSVVPLLSVYCQKLDSLASQKQSHPEVVEAAEENEIVDVANIDPEAAERAKLHRRMEREKPLSRDEQAQKDWLRKWIPIGTPSQTSEAASMCVRVQRREVKMPLRQAVTSSDRMAAYTPTRLQLRVRLPLLGVSIISAAPEEIAYVALENLQLSVRDTATLSSLQLSLDKMQIDNLMHDAVFPVILNAASVKPRDWMPVLQLAVTRQKIPGVNIACFEYVSFLLQALDVRLTELYIYQLLDFANELTARIEPDQSSMDRSDQYGQVSYRTMSDELLLPASQLRTLFFRFLHLQPLAVNLSFEANPGIRNHYIGGFAVNPLMAALSVLEAGVGSLDSAPIRLNGKIIERHLGSPESVARSLAAHYIKEGIKQIYKVFGSLECLGNPVALGASLGAGVKSFFHEPAQGLMVSPEAFGAGLASGSYGLVKNSVAGIGSAVAGIFHSGGKAAAAMSLDQQFITRTSILNAREPDNVGEGIQLGAKSLATGLKEGIKGIVMDPVHGAQQSGAKGLVKGLGTGLLGAVAKPVSGAMTLVAQTAKGIANTGDYLADGPRHRLRHVRAKRFIDPLDPRLTVYSAREAEEALDDRKRDAGDVARLAERQERYESESRIIMATVDQHFNQHSNPQMVEQIRKDNEKIDLEQQGSF